MQRQKVFRGLLIAVMLVALVPFIPAAGTPASVHAQEGEGEVPRFEPVDECFFEVPAEAVDGQDVVCGYLVVPEFHAEPDGDTIRLGVAIIRSTAADPAPDPLVMAQGGPGGSTIDLYGDVLLSAAGNALRAERDIILFDQRGTLHSEPYLSCPETFEAELETLDDELTDDEELERDRIALADCRTRLLEEEINLSAFNSVENAADIAALAQALGYESINYYGISYGTLLGLHALRDHSDILRSVILDAVVPTSINFLPAVAFNGDQSFQLMLETCAADEVCSTNYPDLEETLFTLVDELNEDPVIVTLRDSDSGESYPALITGDIFIDSMFSFMYQTTLIPSMPRMIVEFSEGRYSRFESWLSLFFFEQTLARGMYLSVICAEDADFTPEDFIRDDVNPTVFDALVGDEDFFAEVCALWDVTALDDYVDDPVMSDVPTLLFSGAFDPVTPPSNAEVAAESLENSYNYVFPFSGHGVFVFDDCATSMGLAFLADPASAPDDSCIAQQELTFALPSVGSFADPEGRFQVDAPGGWNIVDESGDYATFEEPVTGATAYVLAVPAEDVDSGIAAAFDVLLPDFSGEAVQRTESGDWVIEFYIVGEQDLLLIVTQNRDEVSYTLFVETTLNDFETIVNALDEILLAIQIN